jgi:heterodisulfide reductase subunit A
VPDSSRKARFGVYVCHCGGNISYVVDVEHVVGDAAKMPGVAISRANMFMCSDPGQSMIQEDIKSGLVDNVLTGACTWSLHQTACSSLLSRNGINPYLSEQANISDQCSWPRHGLREANAKASTLIRMVVPKDRRLAPLEPVRADAINLRTGDRRRSPGLRAANDLSGLGILVCSR